MVWVKNKMDVFLSLKGVWELKYLGSLFFCLFFFVKQSYGLCLDKLFFLMKIPTLESLPQSQSIIKPSFSFLFLFFTSSFPSFLIYIFCFLLLAFLFYDYAPQCQGRNFIDPCVYSGILLTFSFALSVGCDPKKGFWEKRFIQA